MDNAPSAACCCKNKMEIAPKPSAGKVKKTVKSIPGILVSVGIVFFPKCPLCWAAYMSMFSSLGLSSVPYMKWLLPVLVVFLVAHLWIIFRRVKENGYGPFIFSLAGAIIIMSYRMFFTDVKVMLWSGMFLILAGSLWNSFSGKSLDSGDWSDRMFPLKG